METVRDVTKRPREDLMLIVHPCREQYFPTTFYHSRAKYAKNHERYDSKNYDQYFIKTGKKSPRRPREAPGKSTRVLRLLYNPLVKDNFLPVFIILREMCFILSKLSLHSSRHSDDQMTYNLSGPFHFP